MSEPQLHTVFERAVGAAFTMPRGLASRYDGNLAIGSPCVYANFVASVDGVVALGTDDESGHIVSGNSEADRFVMGLLRAHADAVLVGAETLRKSPSALWHAEAIDPARANEHAALRAALGLRPRPKLVVLTASGDIDTAQPGFGDAIVITGAASAVALRRNAPRGTEVLAIDDVSVPLAAAVRELRARGFARLLTEGGPTLVGELIAHRLLDELFVTLAPALFGRYAGDGRKSLLDGVALPRVPLELRSLRHADSEIFLRYALPRDDDAQIPAP